MTSLNKYLAAMKQIEKLNNPFPGMKSYLEAAEKMEGLAVVAPVDELLENGIKAQDKLSKEADFIASFSRMNAIARNSQIIGSKTSDEVIELTDLDAKSKRKKMRVGSLLPPSMY